MNISEFERTKPTETMKALNKLIKSVSENVELGRKHPQISFSTLTMAEILSELKDIKEKFKNGK
jgi:hypothetical protein